MTSNIIEAVVSIKRLQVFLDSAELQVDARKVEIPAKKLQQGDIVLSIKNGEFRWSKDTPTSTLEDINLTVRKGELLGVLGRVGSGKVRWFLNLLRKYHYKFKFLVESSVCNYRRLNPGRW